MASGSVDPLLYVFVLMVRAQVSGQTQDIEGMNSILKVLTQRSTHMHLPLANARLVLKLMQKTPYKVTPDMCVGLDESIAEFMASPQHVERFAPIPIGGGVGQTR